MSANEKNVKTCDIWKDFQRFVLIYATARLEYIRINSLLKIFEIRVIRILKYANNSQRKG